MNCNSRRTPKLVREVQPPHIYMRGDGRLKSSKQSTTYQYNPTFVSFNPCSCFRCSAISRRSCRISKTELRAAKSGLAQPIVAGFPQTGLPEGLGRLVSKAPAYCLAYRTVSQPPAGRVAEYLPRHRGYTRTCSCDAFRAQHTFWRLRWGISI